MKSIREETGNCILVSATEEDKYQAVITGSGSTLNRLVLRNSDAGLDRTETGSDPATSSPCDSELGTIPDEPGMLLKALTAVIESADLPEMIDTLNGTLKSITDVKAVKVRLKDSSLVWVGQTTSPIEDTDGRLLHFVTVVEDRTERQKILQELETTNNTLRVERSMLENKNIALKEIMEQIDQYKTNTNQQLQANVNRVIRPMLQILADKLSPSDQHLIGLIDSTLRDLLDPFVGKLDQLAASLTRREAEVCNMIRNGFSSKQIASVLHTSICTVHNQRRSIRKKLQIADGITNLESLLKSL